MSTDNELKPGALGGCAALIAMLVLTPFSAWLTGFSIATYWSWFIMPVLGVPAITWVQALAIYWTVHAFTESAAPVTPSYADDAEAFWGTLRPSLFRIAVRVFVLAFGAAYHWWLADKLVRWSFS